MSMYEKMVALEVENEDGETQVWTVKRIITQEPNNPSAVFSNELIFRPGGGAIARRKDDRVMTLADDSIADAHRRQEEETNRLRENGLTQARTGGEQAIQPTGEQVGSQAPGRRPRRGSQQGGQQQANEPAPAA